MDDRVYIIPIYPTTSLRNPNLAIVHCTFINIASIPLCPFLNSSHQVCISTAHPDIRLNPNSYFLHFLFQSIESANVYKRRIPQLQVSHINFIPHGVGVQQVSDHGLQHYYHSRYVS
ncbi:hypothetical protein PTI98_008721 [Pleurotus ostreatus]|nr:hypothetical protein PTI98_008721 [Pleurotus ostreatus]